jgi:Tfp pilus assembly protein PilV
MKMSKLKRNKNYGLIFLEVLVAITVLSVGVLFVFRAFMATMQLSQINMDRYRLMLLVEEKAWELRCLSLKSESRLEGSGLDSSVQWTAEQKEKAEDVDYHEWEIRVNEIKEKKPNYLRLNIYVPQEKTL